VGCFGSIGPDAGRHYATVIARATGSMLLKAAKDQFDPRHSGNRRFPNFFGGVNRGNRGPLPLIGQGRETENPDYRFRPNRESGFPGPTGQLVGSSNVYPGASGI
jgi:hypothetical protein